MLRLTLAAAPSSPPSRPPLQPQAATADADPSWQSKKKLPHRGVEPFAAATLVALRAQSPPWLCEPLQRPHSAGPGPAHAVAPALDEVVDVADPKKPSRPWKQDRAGHRCYGKKAFAGKKGKRTSVRSASRAKPSVQKGWLVHTIAPGFARMTDRRRLDAVASGAAPTAAPCCPCSVAMPHGYRHLRGRDNHNHAQPMSTGPPCAQQNDARQPLTWSSGAKG